jgi:hypothetical protein
VGVRVVAVGLRNARATSAVRSTLWDHVACTVLRPRSGVPAFEAGTIRLIAMGVLLQL